MRNVLTCGFLLSLLLTAPVEAPAVQTVQVDKHALKLEPPEGDCAYSQDDAKDAAALAQLEHANEGKRQVLLAFSDCADLDAMHAGHAQNKGDYGHILAPLAIQDDLPRTAYVQRLAQGLTQHYGRIESDPKKLDDLLLDATLETGHVKVLGVVQSAPDLVQTATLENIQLPGKSLRALGVITDTKLGVPVLIALYRLSEGTDDASQLKALAERGASYARGLIALQSKPDTSTEGWKLPLFLLLWVALLLAGLAFVRRGPKTKPSSS